WMGRRRQFGLTLRSGLAATKPREVEALERCELKIGMTRKVELITSEALSEPGAWRVLKPAVLIPAGMSDNLTDQELDAVLLHELIHIKRADNLSSNFQMLLCCVFWFHPLVWLIDRRLLSERERACDEAVIRLGAASDVYASSLLKVLKFCLG